MTRRSMRWASSFLLAWLCLFAPGAIAPALAADLATELRIVAGDDSEKAAAAVERIKAAGDPRALPALQALDDGNLAVDAAGNPFIESKAGNKAALPGGAAKPTSALKTLEPDNTLRRALLPALAALKLTSPDRDIRLAAAEELGKRPSDDVASMVRSAIAKESDAKVKTALNLVIAELDLASEDPARRIHALGLIRESGNLDFKADLERMLGKGGNAPSEKDPKVRDAASAALSSIETRVLLVGMVGHLFYGVSLGSVLLLAALGLAITFGLMRVINMAHGEMLMLGAYTTYVVQNFFQKNLPGAFDWYLVAAIPAAFCVCYVIGAILERSVIQFLYGRPLETLLATWGISLGLIQTVRLIFGAQNVTVANPSWLSGGYQLLPGIVLTYSRMAVIVFAIVVVAFVWLWMNKTPVGLRVRAVTQNREMAAAMGIPTKRVDLGTFGLGSGIAGLGGVAISQLGNVGPELGQGYIVDSFMVVVLGGVGKIVGTIAGALGLGIVNKLLEPAAGAVLGKIIILGLIILFIQKRPQGIFALKGRAAEAG
jgi:urea transport system permease protein